MLSFDSPENIEKQSFYNVFRFYHKGTFGRNQLNKESTEAFCYRRKMFGMLILPS